MKNLEVKVRGFTWDRGDDSAMDDLNLGKAMPAVLVRVADALKPRGVFACWAGCSTAESADSLAEDSEQKQNP